MAVGKMICSINRLIYSWIPHRKKHILLLKQDVLGDWIIFLPYARAVRKHFHSSKYQLTIMVQPRLFDFVRAMEISDDVRECILYRNRFQYLAARLYFWISNYFDTIIVASGFPADYTYPYGKNCLVTLWDPRLDFPYEVETYFHNVIYSNQTSIHERYLQLVRTIGIEGSVTNFDLSKWKEDLPAVTEEKYCVICTGASDPKRCWEEEKFSSLIDLIWKHYGLKILLVSTEEEYSRAERIRYNCSDPDHVVNMCGKTSILQLVKIISKAEFVVSNETGPSHIAGCSGTKVFIISGGGDYGSFVPYPPETEGKKVFSIFRKDQHCFRCGWQDLHCCKKATYPCIADIPVEEVYAKICQVMDPALKRGQNY